MPESPRFLHEKGQIQESGEILEEMKNINKPKNINYQFEKEYKKPIIDPQNEK